jgi:hypothetical protein
MMFYYLILYYIIHVNLCMHVCRYVACMCIRVMCVCVYVHAFVYAHMCICKCKCEITCVHLIRCEHENEYEHACQHAHVNRIVTCMQMHDLLHAHELQPNTYEY